MMASLRTRTGLALVGFLVIGAFFLLTEHRAHFFGLLPFLLLLACPLMHVFMHGGHGGHGDGPSERGSDHAAHRARHAPQSDGGVQ